MSVRAFGIVCAFVAAMMLWEMPVMAQAVPRGGIEGVVVSREDNEVLAGATIIVLNADAQENWSAITNAAGVFRIYSLPTGSDYEVLIIYGETKTRMVGLQVSAAKITRVWPKLDLNSVLCCACGFGGEPLISIYENSIGTTIESTDIKLVPYLELDFGSSVHQKSEHLYLVGGVNTAGLPHLAYVNRNFVELIDVTVAGAEVQAPFALGTYREVILRSGSNALRGSIWAQMISEKSADSMQVGTTISGPIVKDKAWFYQGGVAELADLRTSKPSSPGLNHQWLTRLDYMPTPENSGSLRHVLTVKGNAVVDDLGAKWSSKLFDAKTTFTAIVGFHHGTSAAMRDRRLSARIQSTQRFNAYGSHELMAGTAAETERLETLGAQHRATQQANSLAVYARDNWSPTPSLSLEAGLRAESLLVEPIRARWGPRIAAAYDWTKEGRSKAFATVRRLYPGASLTSRTSLLAKPLDETSMGAAYELGEDLAIGGDFLQRRSEEAELDIDAFSIRLRRRANNRPKHLALEASYTYAYTASDLAPLVLGAHRVKLDGYYVHRLSEESELSCGLSLRANVGSIARSRANLRLRYQRQLDDDQSLEVFTEVRSASAANTGAIEPTPSIHQGLRYSY